MKPIDRVSTSPELRDVKWLYTKDIDWENDRIVVGPLTTPNVDLQKERVLLGRDRLNYIFKHGKLIYEHHANAADPVIILGDCLGIGTDKVGKTFAIWGIADGSESVDEAWGEMKKFGMGGGFSIGGKRTEVECDNGVCTLNNPEVTEVSWTPRPANPECTVYYISQFAKHLIDEAEQDTFELKSQVKKMNKHLGERFKVDPMFDVKKIQSTYPCTKEYVMGMMEQGLKRDEAEQALEDYLIKISKEVNEMEQDQTIEKMDMEPAQNPAQSGGNAVLDLLGQLVNMMTEVKTAIQGMSGSAPQIGQEETMEKEPEPPVEEEKDDGDGSGDDTGDDYKEPEGDGGDKKKKPEIEKSDDSMNLPEGENPEPEAPNPADTEEEGKTSESSEISLPDGEDPDPEGPDPDTVDQVNSEGTDKGDADQDGAVLNMGEGENPPEEGPNTDMSKGLIKKPTKDDVSSFLKQNGFTIVKHDARSHTTVDDPFADAANQPEKYAKQDKKSILKQLKDGIFNVNKS